MFLFLVVTEKGLPLCCCATLRGLLVSPPLVAGNVPTICVVVSSFWIQVCVGERVGHCERAYKFQLVRYIGVYV